MTASEGSYIGLAKQTAKGTPNTTDAEFTYLLLLRSALGPNNVNLPLDMEVGGGALPRSVVKAGVTSGGPISLIPRPESIGHLLMGYFGNVANAVEGAVDDVGTFTHEFSFDTSQFSAPYYTIRNSPGGMFGHQYQDCRLQALNFTFRAADFVRAQAAFVGGLPAKDDTATWSPGDYLDEGPQFLSVLSHIEIPDATAWKVLQGSLSLQSAIPLDQQWIVGSYVPDDFAINQRQIMLNMVVKVADDGALYNKMAIDPDAGTAWVADLIKHGSIDLQFVSNVSANNGAGVPHSLKFEANGQSGGDENVVFTVTPLEVIPGRQIVMNVRGTFLADPTSSDSPITATLVNGSGTDGAAYY